MTSLQSGSLKFLFQASVPKKSSYAAKKKTLLHPNAEPVSSEHKDSTSPVRKNNINANTSSNEPAAAVKNKNPVPENKDPDHSEHDNTAAGPGNKKSGQQPSRIRNSLVPAIFLAADQTNGPVKRNFTIASKKDPSDREKVATKLAALKKSSLPSNPFSEPMQVYPLKRDSISKPS